MKFYAYGIAFHWGKIHIYHEGTEFEDEHIIKKLLKSKYNHVHYYSPEEPEKPVRVKKETAPKRKPKETYPEVPPLSMPDVELELRLAAEEEAIKKTDAELEAEAKVALQMEKDKEIREGKERAELRKSHRVRSKK